MTAACSYYVDYNVLLILTLQLELVAERSKQIQAAESLIVIRTAPCGSPGLSSTLVNDHDVQRIPRDEHYAQRTFDDVYSALFCFLLISGAHILLQEVQEFS